MTQASVHSGVDEFRAQLGARPYAYTVRPDACGPEELLAVARSFGEIRVPPGAVRPYVVATPTASSDARAEARRPYEGTSHLPWHNDFSTHRGRPRWTIMAVQRAHEAGGGRFRVAPLDDILRQLQGSGYGDVLRAQRLPFATDGRCRWFNVFYRRRGVITAIRFNPAAILNGAQLTFADSEERLEETRRLVTAILKAADAVKRSVPLVPGTIIVLDNDRVLHSRTALRGSPRKPRRAFISFVDSPGTALPAERRIAQWTDPPK